VKLWVDFELSITLKTLNEKNGWMNHDNRKNWNKNFVYQIVHTIWLRFFRPYVPMNILSGWFLSVSLFVCVFYLYVFFFVCLCVYALSLRFFPIRTSVKSSRAHDFCLSVCLSLSCFFYFSVCLFFWRIFVCLSLLVRLSLLCFLSVYVFVCFLSYCLFFIWIFFLEDFCLFLFLFVYLSVCCYFFLIRKQIAVWARAMARTDKLTNNKLGQINVTQFSTKTFFVFLLTVFFLTSITRKQASANQCEVKLHCMILS
jgi:hypothetical protein